MSTPALSDWLLQHLDRRQPQPVVRQLLNLLRKAIIEGALPARTRLPSTRLLAAELGIARNTVIEVYEQLAVEGCVQTLRGSGTVVADVSVDRPIAAPRPPQPGRHAASATAAGNAAQDLQALSPRGRDLLGSGSVSPCQWGAFMPGVPDVTEVPLQAWTRLHNRCLRQADPDHLSYAPAGGLRALREALATYLRTARSVRCEPQQVVITTGSHQALDLSVRLLASAGDRVWLEDPCYWGLRSTLVSLGADIEAIPVDGEGLAWREDAAADPKIIVVSPSHQYPLGMVMSLPRRQALLSFAMRRRAWVIEDDYDSEFRYGSRPLPSLQGLDGDGRVLYVGSFSKVMFPGLRIGYLVVPPALCESFAMGSAALYREGQGLQQAVLAEFIAQGHLGAHVRRMRGLYDQRRQALLAAIASHFGTRLEVQGSDAGLHLVLRLPPGTDDQAIARTALAAGVATRPLSVYHAQPADAPRGLLLGYACVKPEAIAPAFGTVAAAILQHLPAGHP